MFRSVDKNARFIKKCSDGGKVRKGQVVAEVKGSARGILTAERTALNFLQRLSGISTLTRKFVDAAGGRVNILDTRKTSPGLRVLEKYAVKVGGGTNHRIGLFDGVLIKDNHIAVTGDLTKTVEAAMRGCEAVEVEANTMKQVEEAAGSGASRILLDNMSVPQIKQAVKIIRSRSKKIEIEISGGVNLNNIKSYSKACADYISIGALTHSAPALDISLKIDQK